MKNRLSSMCPNLDSHNDVIAVCEKDRVITYGELARAVRRLSGNITITGVLPGSRIALCSDNTASFICGYMAILEAGCIPVLLSPGLPAEKCSYILEDSGAAGVVGDAKVLSRISAFPPRMRFVFADAKSGRLSLPNLSVYSLEESVRSDNPDVRHAATKPASEAIPADIVQAAAIIYTSGTTGKPKGVVLTESNLLIATSTIIRHMELKPSDACLVTMSFAHCAGLLHLLAHLQIGAKVITGETFTLIGPFLGAIKRHAVTVLPAVPSFYALLSKQPRQKIRPYLESIRAVESSSAMINTSLIREIEDIFPSAILFNTYGLTEAPRATYMRVDSVDQDTSLSVGFPTAGVDICVVDQKLRHCRPYEMGEIIVQGPNVASGYWNRPEKTAATFTSCGFRTGDIGYMDSRGLVYLKGREDDMIKIGAEAVYPQEVEETIASYPGVADVLAYGVDDELQGAAIHAKVVRRDTKIDEKRILDFCRERLEKHKVPSNIILCEFIDLEDSGKPKRGGAVSW